MTTSQNGAYEIHKHLADNEFAQAFHLLSGIPAGTPEWRSAVAECHQALVQKHSGPDRDNGFTALIGLLLEVGDLEKATEVLDSVGSDSRVHFNAFAEQINQRLRERLMNS